MKNSIPEKVLARYGTSVSLTRSHEDQRLPLTSGLFGGSIANVSNSDQSNRSTLPRRRNGPLSWRFTRFLVLPGFCLHNLKPTIEEGNYL